MPQFQLAQVNVAQMKAPLESPVMAEFVANLDRINALAEQSAGYIWRLQTEDGDATSLRPFGDDMIVNMSVWEGVSALRAFVFSTKHVEIMRRRSEWFERMAEAYVVLWWIPVGHIPTVEEAKQRLATLRSIGPSPAAFTFRTAVAPP